MPVTLLQDGAAMLNLHLTYLVNELDGAAVLAYLYLFPRFCNVTTGHFTQLFEWDYLVGFTA